MASADSSWISITSGGTGNGNGLISYSVAANSTGVPRTGTILVGTRPFSVSQSAINGPAGNAPDFGIGLAAAIPWTIPGGTVSFQMGVAFYNGFNQPVTLTAAFDSIFTGYTVTPSTVTVSSGGNVTFTVHVPGNATAGYAALNVVGTGGGITNSLQLGIPVAFSLLPGQPHTYPGASASLPIVLRSAPTFTSSVTVTVALGGNSSSFTVSPAQGSAPNPETFPMPVGTTGCDTQWSCTIAYNISVPTGIQYVGQYPVTITASSGTLSTSFPTILYVDSPNDFFFTLPSSVSLEAGTSQGFGVSIFPSDPTVGFNGTVSFSLVNIPQPSWFSGSIPSAGIGNWTGSVSVALGVPAGSYSLTVTGTSQAGSNTLTHVGYLTVNVTAPPTPTDFTLSVPGWWQGVNSGQSTGYSLNVTNFTASPVITFSLAGTPTWFGNPPPTPPL